MPSITKEKKAELISKFGKNENDSGNAKVQVAMITERILNLTEHVKQNKKDKSSTRGLITLVAERKKHLKFIANKNLDEYRSLIKELGLRK
ncbi:MAG: 30S ribosomal protein S15 [Fibrobacterales bacterium]